MTSEAVRCPSCHALVHPRHRRCPRCRAHLEVKPAVPLASPYLKFAAIGIVIAFGAVVAGLWITRAEPMADVAKPADPMKVTSAAPAAPATRVGDGPVETRPLLEPEEVRVSSENALAAQAVASAALHDDPDNLKALGSLGSALLNLHEPAKALPLFEHAARLAPDQWVIQFNLARAQVQLGRWTAAVGSLRLVRTMRPDDYTAAFNLGLALHRSGDDERAIDEYRRAIAIGPHDGSLFRSLAISLQRSGRSADAVRAYQDYLRLMPDAADAEQINGRIAALVASDQAGAPRQNGAPAVTR